MLTPGAFEDRRSLLTRLTVLRAGAVVIFTVLAVAFWTLQVAQHAKYSEWADNNYMRQIPLRAPRGVLFDRGGRVLVENRDSFTISIIRERTTDLEGAVTILARVTGVDEQYIREVVQRHKREASFRPIPVIEHASFAQVAAVRARQLELPGVDVQQVPARAYPEGGLGAHLFGYVSEIQETQLDRPEYAGLEAGAIVGQSGIERVYNASLQGTDGRRNVVDQQRRPRNPRARGRESGGRQAAAADHRLRPPAGARRGLPQQRVRGRRRVSRPAHGRSPGDDQPAGLRSQRLCGRHRGPEVGRAATKIR